MDVNGKPTRTPLYKTYRQIKKEKRRKERASVGLVEDHIDVRERGKDPKYDYVGEPKAKTAREL